MLDSVAPDSAKSVLDFDRELVSDFVSDFPRCSVNFGESNSFEPGFDLPLPLALPDFALVQNVAVALPEKLKA